MYVPRRVYVEVQVCACMDQNTHNLATQFLHITGIYSYEKVGEERDVYIALFVPQKAAWVGDWEQD